MLTHGDGDPAIPAAVQAAHDAAAADGALTYRDPRTGGVVITRVRLIDQGHCCGVGCRHCPYPSAEQAESGRERVRPGRRGA
jgi:hypothetical protein